MGRAPSPSRIVLPKLAQPPATIFEFLCGYFPRVTPEEWRRRFTARQIWMDDRVGLSLETAYRAGATVLYFRESSEEVTPRADERGLVIYEDERILIADKPHFMPITPTGKIVSGSLLVTLQQRASAFGLEHAQRTAEELAPVHRLDRETAGLVLFTKRKQDRGAYAHLFEQRAVEKLYLAVGDISREEGRQLTAGTRWKVESRIEAEPGSFLMRSDPELPFNAITEIVLCASREGRGLFELRPATGKKHQLRLHMAALGFPILHDAFYFDPQPHSSSATAPSQPLQLLAAELRFRDPIDGSRREFVSSRRLHEWSD